MKAFLPGGIIEVSGLKNAAQYNGCRGLVLRESKPDDNGNPRHPIRLFEHRGKVLDVRVRNLQHAFDLDKWKVPQFGGTSIMEMILRNKSLADEDNCGVFATKLWSEIAEQQGEADPRYEVDAFLHKYCILKQF